MSRDRAIALQPGQQERNSVSKKKFSRVLGYHYLNPLTALTYTPEVIYNERHSITHDVFLPFQKFNLNPVKLLELIRTQKV